MKFSEYKNITIEPELGLDIEQVADEAMKNWLDRGWQVICVCPHPRQGKLLITFGKPA